MTRRTPRSETAAIAVTVNGDPQVWPEDADRTLAATLRRRGYTSVKIGCDTGECGSCTVLLNHRPVRACVTALREVDKGELLTVEGLAAGEVLHPLQQAFLETGAVQCGFCTPAMLLAAEALLRRNPSPSETDVRRALGRVSCRCTGYQKPVEAVLAAMRPAANGRPSRALLTGAVGAEVPRVDGVALVRGEARFTEDFELPGMLHGKMLWSPHAHARIRSIDWKAAAALPGVHAVLCHENTPRVAYTRAGQDVPEPSPHDYFLFDRKVRYVGDRVAAVAAETGELAEQALSLIRVDYEILPPVFDPREADQPGAPVIHDEPDATGIADAAANICAQRSVVIGAAVDDVMTKADLVLERTYRTHRVQHAQLEAHAAISHLDERGRLTIRTGTQVPFHLRRQIARLFGLPISDVRILRPAVGGGFGSRQEVVVEDVCAALTLAARRPVRFAFSRTEEFVSARCRHPMEIRITTGVEANGALLANRMDVLCDAGACGSHSPTVSVNAGTKNLPRYPTANLEFRFKAVYTNNVVGGAFRGYGTPQGAFALECHIDELAGALGRDPLAYRLEICRRPADRDLLSPRFYGPGSGVAQGWAPLAFDPARCLRVVAERIRWKERRAELDAWNREARATRRGLGVAFVSQGSGVAGSQKVSAQVRMAEDGSFLLLVETGELGGGSDTALTKIAADSLGVPMGDVRLVTGDTDLCPWSSGAFASGTTFLGGRAVAAAASQLLEQLKRLAGDLIATDPAKLVCEDRSVRAKARGRSVSYADIAQDALRRQGRPLEASGLGFSTTSPPPFAAQFAEVEVALDTGAIRVTDFLSVVDCGRVVNPLLAEGQVEGAVAQGLGYALSEELQIDASGRVSNPTFGTYRCLRADELPGIRTLLLEPSADDEAEPRSIGEIGINGPAPAVASAIHHATGIRIRELPIRADALRDALLAPASGKPQ